MFESSCVWQYNWRRHEQQAGTLHGGVTTVDENKDYFSFELFSVKDAVEIERLFRVSDDKAANISGSAVRATV